LIQPKEFHQRNFAKANYKTYVTMPEHLEMDFCDVDNVVTSWEKLRRLPDYEIEAGTILFTQ